MRIVRRHRDKLSRRNMLEIHCTICNERFDIGADKVNILCPVCKCVDNVAWLEQQFEEESKKKP